MTRRFRWGLLALVLVTSSCFAWVQFLAPITSGILWLGRVIGSNVTMARAVEWSILGHGAVFTFLSWRNTNETSTASASGHLEVSFDPAAQRANPDPSKWDDPAAGQRDPTPKASVSQSTSQGTMQPPGTLAGIVADMGWQAGSKYYQKDATTDVLYTVQLTSSCSSPGSGPSGMVYVGCVPSAQTPVTTYAQMVAEMGVPGSKCYQYNGSTDVCYVTKALTTCSGYSAYAPAGYQAAVCSNWNTQANSYAYPGIAAVYSRSQAPSGYAVWKQEQSIACPAGYTSNGSGTCQLSDATQVMKPAGTVACELRVNADGTWDIDAKNPSCTSLQGVGRLSCTGRTCTYSRGAGDYDQIVKNPDGTGTISTRGSSGNRDISIGAPGPEGTPITGLTDIPSGSTPPGGGSTGSGGGSCGGTGQVECAVNVNDGSFQGKDAIVNGKADAAALKLDDRIGSADQSKFQGTFGVDESWLPRLAPGNPVSCSALQWQTQISHGPLSGFNHVESIDLCGKTDLIRQYYSWLWYAMTVWAIAMLFFGTNGNARTR